MSLIAFVKGQRVVLPGFVAFVFFVYLLSSVLTPVKPRAPLWSPPHIRDQIAASNGTFFEDETLNLPAKRAPRYAISSSVMTARFSQYAMMLAYSIQKYNDLAALDAELILLVRTGDGGVTPQNITRLESVGWRIIVEKDLDFEDVDESKIRSHHRHNLNKLYLWSYTQYERIIFIDADTLCKGSLADLFRQPGEIAGSPDVWWDILTDTRFNSGVISFRPSIEEFHNMVKAVSDPNMHKPNDADQAFLNAYFRFRFHSLPYKYNFNIIMYQHHRGTWDKLWNEAIIVHFTTKKPMPTNHCRKGCNEWEPSEWYMMVCKEMLAFYGYENELPVLG